MIGIIFSFLVKTYYFFVPERDYDFDYFGYKTMEKSYLKRVGSSIQDRPGYMVKK